MAILCSTSAPYILCKSVTDKFLSRTSISSSFKHPNRSSFCPLNFSVTRPLSISIFTCSHPPNFFRFSGGVAAGMSEPQIAGSVSSVMDEFKMTYLEGNSWLWNLGGLKFLVDPVFVGTLDFGIPWLFDGARKVLKNLQLSDFSEVDCLLITQSLDDHCHLKTLKKLSEMLKSLKVIATPNAKSKLAPLFNNVTYLEPGQSSEVATRSGSNVKVQATHGPVFGPPWQLSENGYIVTCLESGFSLYHEPHCVYSKQKLPKESVDVVITPVIKLSVLGYTLVSGQEDAVQLAKHFHARFVVPMNNGELDAKGLLASLLLPIGTVNSFKELLRKEMPETKVLEPSPGKPLLIPLT